MDKTSALILYSQEGRGHQSRMEALHEALEFGAVKTEPERGPGMDEFHDLVVIDSPDYSLCQAWRKFCNVLCYFADDNFPTLNIPGGTVVVNGGLHGTRINYQADHLHWLLGPQYACIRPRMVKTEKVKVFVAAGDFVSSLIVDALDHVPGMVAHSISNYDESNFKFAVQDSDAVVSTGGQTLIETLAQRVPPSNIFAVCRNTPEAMQAVAAKVSYCLEGDGQLLNKIQEWAAGLLPVIDGKGARRVAHILENRVRES